MRFEKDFLSSFFSIHVMWYISCDWWTLPNEWLKKKTVKCEKTASL